MNYRLLNVGEKIKDGDSYFRINKIQKEWVDCSELDNMPLGEACLPVRREIKSVSFTSYTTCMCTHKDPAEHCGLYKGTADPMVFLCMASPTYCKSQKNVTVTTTITLDN